jgi:hypothetical protein
MQVGVTNLSIHQSILSNLSILVEFTTVLGSN